MAVKNPIRQDVKFILIENDEEHEFTVKPSFDRISAVEDAMGAANPLLGRVLGGQLGVKQMCQLVAVILKGQPGAPKERTIHELVYAKGAYTYIGPCAVFLLEATKAGEAEEEPEKKTEGVEGEAGNE